jgi:vacuolar iron transporter family protein
MRSGRHGASANVGRECHGRNRLRLVAANLRRRSTRPDRRPTVRKYLPDLIYGANDGVITTLAVVSGVVGAALSTSAILVLGFANLLADGFSMGASNVLSRRSEAKNKKLPSLGAAAEYGMATFIGFVVAGIVPLLAYLLPWFGDHRFSGAAAMAPVTLFAVGAECVNDFGTPDVMRLASKRV